MEKRPVRISESAERLGSKGTAGEVLIAPPGPWQPGVLDLQRADEIRLVNAAASHANQRAIAALGNFHREPTSKPCDPAEVPSSDEAFRPQGFHPAQANLSTLPTH